jgi:hypothetical protein
MHTIRAVQLFTLDWKQEDDTAGGFKNQQPKDYLIWYLSFSTEAFLTVNTTVKSQNNKY